MSPSISELMRALPELDEPAQDAREPLLAATMRPVPVGRWRRLRLLATLQAQIAAAYLFYWVRGWFLQADQRERMLAETHWKAALRLLDSMGYLRGAVMKVGQTLANFPDIVPRQFVETLDQLHYNAPPMHWALLREMVRNELGDDPENVFAWFDTHAFAAASLGQVHRRGSRLARTSPSRFNIPAWPGPFAKTSATSSSLSCRAASTRTGRTQKTSFTICRRGWSEKPIMLRKPPSRRQVRSSFREDDGIVVPRVYPEYSTARILTMDRLDGIHIDKFMARDPSQEERNEFACKMIRAWARMVYAGRLSYADWHPGNFLFMDDGRLGVIDFGFVVAHGDEEWRLLRLMDRGNTTGRREDRIAAMKEWSYITDDPIDADRLRLHDEFAEWCWLAHYRGVAFDFGDEVDFRRGVDLFIEMVRKQL